MKSFAAVAKNTEATPKEATTMTSQTSRPFLVLTRPMCCQPWRLVCSQKSSKVFFTGFSLVGTITTCLLWLIFFRDFLKRLKRNEGFLSWGPFTKFICRRTIVNESFLSSFYRVRHRYPSKQYCRLRGNYSLVRSFTNQIWWNLAIICLTYWAKYFQHKICFRTNISFSVNLQNWLDGYLCRNLYFYVFFSLFRNGNDFAIF